MRSFVSMCVHSEPLVKLFAGFKKVLRRKIVRMFPGKAGGTSR